MNILVLTTSYPAFSGDLSGNFIHSLVRSLARRGHALRVVVPGRVGCTGRREVDGIETHHFRYALTDRGQALTSVPGGIPEALRRSRLAALNLPGLLVSFTAAALRHARWADVIHANWLGAGLCGAIATSLRHKPLVLTLRGDDAYLVHDRAMWRRAGKFVFNRCATVTAVSRNMVPLLKDFVPARVGEIIVPTFGVDTTAFHPADAPRPAGAVQGMFVGNVSRAKGVDVLLEALSKCGAKCCMTFVGGGPDLSAMQELAAKLGLADRVAWLGQRPSGDIPDLLRGTDFLVLPSLSEGRPNVVMEAMATGLPVIATDVGSTRELLDDGRGLLVAPGNAFELAAALERLCADATLRQTLGQNGLRYIRENSLTWDSTAAQFESIFQAALQRPR